MHNHFQFSRLGQWNLVDQLQPHIDGSSRAFMDLIQKIFAIGQGQIASVHNKFERNLLNRFLDDLKSTNRREFFDQVRKELARNFSTVGRVECVELSAHHLLQQRQAASASTHFKSSERPVAVDVPNEWHPIVEKI